MVVLNGEWRLEEHLSDLNSLNLSNEQKALVVTDGSVTSLLEAFTGMLVKVVGLNQSKIKSGSEISSEFGLELNSDVLVRKVVLECDEPIIYAVSYAPLCRLGDMSNDFLFTDKPIGRILKDHRIETRREIMWIGRKKIKLFRNSVCRKYFIINSGIRIIKVEEYLNLDYRFKERAI